MERQRYEFSASGINCAIEDYVKTHWSDLDFQGVDKQKLLGFENFQVFVQRDFNGNGEYQFQGDARPMISDNAGGYTVDNKRVHGVARIEIVAQGLFVESISQPISIS